MTVSALRCWVQRRAVEALSRWGLEHILINPVVKLCMCCLQCGCCSKVLGSGVYWSCSDCPEENPTQLCSDCVNRCAFHMCTTSRVLTVTECVYYLMDKHINYKPDQISLWSSNGCFRLCCVYKIPFPDARTQWPSKLHPLAQSWSTDVVYRCP